MKAGRQPTAKAEITRLSASPGWNLAGSASVFATRTRAKTIDMSSPTRPSHHRLILQ